MLCLRYRDDERDLRESTLVRRFFASSAARAEPQLIAAEDPHSARVDFEDLQWSAVGMRHARVDAPDFFVTRGADAARLRRVTHHHPRCPNSPQRAIELCARLAIW